MSSSSDSFSDSVTDSEGKEEYQKLTHREHILKRPDSYIGSVDLHEAKMFVCNEDGKFEKRQIQYVPGLYKIFDEILVNAADNKQRTPPCRQIDVVVDPEQNMISVYNDGKGISVDKQYDKIDDTEYYTPQFIFSQLLTSSNYDDNKEKTTGGRNGYGAKLTNIYSTKFVLDLVSTQEQGSKTSYVTYHQEFSNNMTVINPPVIKKSTSKTTSTKITFYPDLSRFKLQKLDKDHVDLMRRRVYDLAGILPGVKVSWNGQRIEIKTWKDYCMRYLPENSSLFVTVIDNPKRPWKIAVAPSHGEFKQVSFVNSVSTPSGGTHVDLVVEKVANAIKDYLNSTKKGKVDAKVGFIKNYLHVFVDALVPNPAFDSQTKDRLTTEKKKISGDCVIPDSFLDKVKKSEIADFVREAAHFKETSMLNKMKGTKSRRVIVNKLEDANQAGKKDSMKCTLILTEGNSAKGMAVTGLTQVGRDFFGVFPLRGKLLNTRDASPTALAKNEEIQNIIKIMGLDPQKKYEDDDEFNKLRYGSIMIMADQDVDGSHIKGLIINFIHSMWPYLLRREGFLTEFITPIVKATKGKESISFFTIPEFSQWKRDNNNGKGYKMKYYKGLATSSKEETKQYFSNFRRHKKIFRYQDENDEEKINLAFSRKRADDRKAWLADLDVETTYLGTKETYVKYTDFIDKELILFSNYANFRAIPSVIDGWKPGQRKILWVCFKNKIKSDIKVAQLTGKVSEQAAYHHGEESLNQTIIGMAQNFVGSNNINVLKPIGFLGSRLAGGDDAGAPRYVYTCLEPITRLIFHPDDDLLLSYQAEEGLPIEPNYYVPIIPMALVNGSKGIGVGWATEVPQFSPKDIINNIRHKLNGEPMEEMKPWYEGFTGPIIPIVVVKNGVEQPVNKWEIRGKVKKIDDTTIEITELPIGTWTYDYKKFLEGLLQGESTNPHRRVGNIQKEAADKKKKARQAAKDAKDDDEPAPKKTGPKIQDFAQHHSLNHVHFTITVDDKQMAAIEKEGMLKFFKLTDTINATNMVLFDTHGHLHLYKSALEIIDEFFDIRMLFYENRRKFLLDILAHEVKKLTNQARFIKEVIEKTIKVSGIPRRDILITLRDRHYDLYDPNEIQNKVKYTEEVIEKHEEEEEEDEVNSDVGGEELKRLEQGYDYLLSMKIWSLTKEKAEKLMNEAGAKQAQLEQQKKKTARDYYSEDLDNLEKEWIKFHQQREQDRQDDINEAEKRNQKDAALRKKTTKRRVVKKKDDSASDDKSKVLAQIDSGAPDKSDTAVSVEEEIPDKIYIRDDDKPKRVKSDKSTEVTSSDEKPKRSPKKSTTTTTDDETSTTTTEEKPAPKKRAPKKAATPKKEKDEEEKPKKPAPKPKSSQEEKKPAKKATKKEDKFEVSDSDNNQPDAEFVGDSSSDEVETIKEKMQTRERKPRKVQSTIKEFFKQEDSDSYSESYDSDDDDESSFSDEE